jgi:hypothetical protein
VMDEPVFRLVEGERGLGVTYDCGCPCVPTAAPSPEGQAGFEYCCCGKVHFAGPGAESALTAYLAERASRRKREPRYVRGSGTVDSASGAIAVAWAFPADELG